MNSDISIIYLLSKSQQLREIDQKHIAELVSKLVAIVRSANAHQNSCHDERLDQKSSPSSTGKKEG